MAVLQLDRILLERTATKIIKALQSLPTRLQDTYQKTIARIQSQAEPDNTLGMIVLQWISHSKRPLKIDELRHALAVEWDDDEDLPQDFDDGNLLDPESIVDVCAGLVVIEPQSKVIRLVHFTTEEFFRSSPGGVLFPDADAQISRTCLAYLSFDTLRDERCASGKAMDDRMQQFQFLDYAVSYWSEHLRGEPERIHEQLALHFLNSQGNVGTFVQAAYPVIYSH